MLIRNVILPDGRKSNVLVTGGRFADLDVPSEACAGYPESEVLEADGLAILPALYNTHTHAAMTLLRGYGDDLPLQRWLQEYIWPYEAKLTASDIRKGSEIAVREMKGSGTVFFNDMYFEIEETIEAVAASGMRAAIGITVMDNHSLAQTESKKEFVRTFKDPTGGRISLVMAPHSVYCVGRQRLMDCAEFARNHGLKIHIHVSETRREVDDCLKATGMTPVRYLDSIGLLGPDVIAAHCVHVDEEEWDILARTGVTVSHCPCSNMKLGSGRFPYELAIRSGVKMSLGTDGASSNNNLDLREEMKFASLLAKCVSYDGQAIFNVGDTTLLPAKEIMKWATVGGASAFGIDAGVIEKGKCADFVLVDLNSDRFTPLHDLVSDWVYAADSSVVKYTVCDGRIL
ncbi:MAG: amidohydrolase [Bacteroidales bacterium]|nr:amidohydrolase [Bacteroidales bacterium]